jgi:hypothetical protein
MGNYSDNYFTNYNLTTMIIEGRKNLEFMKKAFESHLVSCCQATLSASDKLIKEKWDPEIEETQKMLDAIGKNLERYKEDIPLAPFDGEMLEAAGFFR